MTSQCEPAILPILDQGTAEGLKSFATCTGTGPDVIEKMNALYLKVSISFDIDSVLILETGGRNPDVRRSSCCGRH